jgi:hypothetical protein
MTFVLTTFGKMTFSITECSMATFGIMSFGKITFGISTLSILGPFVKSSINNTQHTNTT